MLNGAATYKDMAQMVQDCQELYQKYLPFENGLPRAGTLRSVLNELEPEKMQIVFARWLTQALAQQQETEDTEAIVINENQVRRTEKDAPKLLRVVRAFDSAMQLVLDRQHASDSADDMLVPGLEKL